MHDAIFGGCAGNPVNLIFFLPDAIEKSHAISKKIFNFLITGKSPCTHFESINSD